MKFFKYHALGNDYIVIDPASMKGSGGRMRTMPLFGVSRLPDSDGWSGKRIKTVCHRNFGVGSDGILYGPLRTGQADCGLRIYNPDGSEAEKSGNGLRIFARYLWDQGKVGEEKFSVWTAGGRVEARVHPGGRMITVGMGKVSFQSEDIPVIGPPREVINETTEIAGNQIVFSAATVGNPHCVVLRDRVTEEEARRLGPLIEVHGLFPNRTNVQFVQVVNRGTLRIEIWERGAGYTLASGSSSSAAAAVANRLGLCENQVTVCSPGGELVLSITDDYAVTLTGAVTKVAEGDISDEIFS